MFIVFGLKKSVGEFNAREHAPYKEFADEFAIRRTDTSFWKYSDTLHSWFKKDRPLAYGVLDYARLENR